MTTTYTSYDAQPPEYTNRPWWALACFGSFTTGLFSCCFGEREELKADETVRARIREAMSQYRAPTIEGTIAQIEQETGYALSAKGTAVAPPPPDPDPGGSTPGVQEVYVGTVLVMQVPVAATATRQGVGKRPPQTIRVFPAFAADMAMLIQSNLGTMVENDANILLVEREYHRLCRKLCVRLGDQASHRQHVINAYFREGIMDRVPLTRSRLPRWLVALGGLGGVHRKPVAC
jgi:hypothetical protein